MAWNSFARELDSIIENSSFLLVLDEDDVDSVTHFNPHAPGRP